MKIWADVVVVIALMVFLYAAGKLAFKYLGSIDETE